MRKWSYRWLLVLLAVVGLTADQWSKYGMFRWLHNARQQVAASDTGTFAAWDDFARAWVAGAPPGITGGRSDVVPGWFGFIAQYHRTPRQPDADWRNGLQTVSANELPVVNRGALFGMGANHDGSPEAEQQAQNANTLFAVISLIAASGIVAWTIWRGKKADAWICAALGLILGGTVGNLFDRVVFHGVRDFLFFYKIDWPVFNIADCCLVCGAIMLVLHAVFVKPPTTPDTQAATATATTATPTATPAPTTAG